MSINQQKTTDLSLGLSILTDTVQIVGVETRSVVCLLANLSLWRRLDSGALTTAGRQVLGTESRLSRLFCFVGAGLL